MTVRDVGDDHSGSFRCLLFYAFWLISSLDARVEYGGIEILRVGRCIRGVWEVMRSGCVFERMLLDKSVDVKMVRQ